MYQQRASRLAAVARARHGLDALSSDLAAHTAVFVERSLEGLRVDLARREDRPSRVHIPYEEPLTHYVVSLNDAAALAVLDAGVTLPRLELDNWAMYAELEVPWQPLRDVPSRLGDVLTRPLDGGSTGRKVGGSIGGW